MNTATRNKRDEMATDWCIEKGVYNKEHFAYQAGFDAAYAIARKEAEVLVEALKRVTDNRAGGCVYVDKMKILKLALKTYEQGQAE